MEKNNIKSNNAAINNQRNTEKDYWIKKMSGVIQKSVFPYDNSIPSQEIKYKTIKFELSKEISQKLLKISNGSFYKLHILLITTGIILLNRYTNNYDSIIGIPILKQKHDVKYTNNALAIRNSINADMTCKELLLQVNKTILEAHDNQNFPLQRLLYNLNILPNHFFPLFDVAILLKEIHQRGYLNEVPINVIFTFALRDNQVFCELEYNANLYKKNTIVRIVKHYCNVAEQIVNDINIKISKIIMLDIKEKTQIIHKFNNFNIDIQEKTTIQDLFEKQVKLNPEKIAVVFNKKTITYAELNKKSNQLARILIKRGIKSDSIIGIMMERSIDMIVAILAVIKTGGAYLPLDWEYPPKRNQYIIENSDVKCVLSHEQLSDKFKTELSYLDSESIICIDKENTCKENASNITNISKPENIAYIIYTSGTTGTPKGVMIRHDNVVNLVNGLNQRIYSHYGNNLRLALLSPYVFDASIKQIFVSLIFGHSLYIVPKETRMSGSELLSFYDEHNIDISDGTPAHLRFISESSSNNDKNMKVKHFLIGGEPLRKNIVESFFNSFPFMNIKITNLYGPTECCVDTTSIDITPKNLHDFTEIPIGYPMPNCTIYILDEMKNIQPIGVNGEIYISGKGVGSGYLKSEKLTQQKFISDPFIPGQLMYKTGDIGRWRCDGFIEFSGRSDFQVKIRGFRIELGEIESEIMQYPGINEAIATLKKNGNNESVLCAYYVADHAVDNSELRSFLMLNLPEYALPNFFVRLDKMPLNNNGKVDRKNLPAPEYKLEREYIAPTNDIEKQLVDIWANVLDLDKSIISTDVSFFEMGGHSLKLTLLNDIIIKNFSIQSSMSELFYAKTVKKQAEYIARELKQNIAILDDHLVLLRKGNKLDTHVFLVHAVEGGVEAFIDFSNLLNPDFSCWGIKAENRIGISPTNLTIEDLAKKYITSIKKVQKHGPYTIAGWSLGGIIVFEIAHQLEKSNERIDFLGLIDPIPPKIDLWEELQTSNKDTLFGLKTELDIVKEWFSGGDIVSEMSKVKNLEEFWPRFIEYCENNSIGLDIIRERITEPVDKANPAYRKIKFGNLLQLYNTRRTLRRAYGNYTPECKLRTAIHYFGATQSAAEYYLDELENYSHQKPKYYEIKGDHFSIFKHPYVNEFAYLFNKLINVSSLERSINYEIANLDMNMKTINNSANG